MCINHTINPDEKASVLIDKTKSGKERPWKDKKIDSISYFELLHILEFKKAERVRDCGNVLEFKADEDLGYLKLYKAWFCKSRLCSLCNWRRAMKHSFQSKKIVAVVMQQKPKARWLLLTLTVRNVWDGEELNKSLSDMAQGFRRMIGYKKVKQNLIGFMRATEVTVNPIDNSYNQHMHVLLCVSSTYFYNTEHYINQKQWIKFWRRAMKLDYDPNVKIQIVKPKNKKKNKEKSDLHSAVDETAKYPVKNTDFMTDDEQKNLKRVADLEEGLYRKRLVSYGGLMKEIHKDLNLDDEEDGDLIHVDEDNEDVSDDEAYSLIAYWNWERRNYFV